MSIEEYRKLTPRESVLTRPQMYFGEVAVSTNKHFTCYITEDEENMKLVCAYEKISISMGLLKMFDEVIVNAFDQISKSRRAKSHLTFISVTITDDGYLIENDGKGIPIKKQNGQYIPEMVFTELFSGSNFGNEKEAAGQNGVGVKLATIYSTFVKVKIITNGKKYEQIYRDNASIIEKPEISQTNANVNLVSYYFEPDWEKLNVPETMIEEIKENTNKMIYRRIVELKTIYTTNSDIRVSVNGITIDDGIITFQIVGDRFWRKYLKFKNIDLSDENSGYTDRFYYAEGKNYKLGIGLSPTHEQISYVNGVWTRDGGVHVNYILDQINKYCQKFDPNCNAKSHLFIVLSADVIDPLFNSQAKVKMTGCKKDDLKNKLTLKEKELKEIYAQLHLDEVLLDKKRTKINGILKSSKIMKDCPKLVDAEDAGKNKCDCTLFICEGDSASSLANIGMTCENIGHKKFGSFPLQGKLNNVRDKGDKYSKLLYNGDVNDPDVRKKLMKNIITQLLITMGLKPNTTYTDTRELRYQHIVMLKDADYDGANILGLVYNVFDTYFPELLQVKGFFNEFITPMIKIHIPEKSYNKIVNQIAERCPVNGTIVIHNGDVALPFYNDSSYKNFMTECGELLPKNIQVEFVKGLAGHQQFEVREYFKHYDENVIPIIYDRDGRKLLERAFTQKSVVVDEESLRRDTAAQLRRKWMNTLPPDGACLERISGQPINISDFMNNDHLEYMIQASLRSIPSVIDGLKIAQRKVIYGLRKQANPYMFRKVFQLTGIIASTANYHHGDQSLNEAIIKMAQDFPGSNNIPLLAGKGFFGSRLALGNDAGQPRYIDVALSRVADIIFPAIDDELLEYVTEDNMVVEPRFYVPIVPLVIINGGKGLGNGYGTTLHPHSALSVIEKIEARLTGKREVPLKLHVNKWNGIIELNNSGKSVSYKGTWKRINPKTVVITEIPIQFPIDDFTKILKENSEEIIEKWQNLNKDINSVKFEIKFTKEVTDEKVINYLKLVNNKLGYKDTKCGIDSNGKLIYYSEYDDMFNEWFNQRKQLYIARKDMLIRKLDLDILILINRIKFVKEVIAKTILLNKLSDEELDRILTEKQYYKHKDSYDYLLSMQMRTMTLEKLTALEKELENKQNELEKLKQTPIEEIWIEELEKLKDLIKDWE